MAEASRVFGTGSKIEHKGVTYNVAPLTLGMIAELEVWMEAQAWLKVERTRGSVDEETYRRRHDAVTRMVASRAFDFSGELAARVAMTEEGQKYLLYLKMKDANPQLDVDVTEELVDEIWSDMKDELRARAEAEAGGEGGPDPNSTPPAS